MIVRLPIRPLLPHDVLPGQATSLGTWAGCENCKRECPRAGFNYCACSAHTSYDIRDEEWNRYKTEAAAWPPAE